MVGLDEEAIFQLARQIDRPDTRQLYLDQACGADADLRARLDTLLWACDEGRSFLERPAVAPPAPGPETVTYPSGGVTRSLNEGVVPVAGVVIGGRYKLLQEIGEGGMGTVFMAEQTEPVRRKVALKLIKPGLDSRQVLARFEAERQALALMDHVNIARVFDGGTTDDGRPYFVMELVKGVPITKFCDDHRLTPRQRLELFVPVCQAIQHAHQKGVIHRDVKPSNVMVTLYDGKPVPKVIDFGVAKATEQNLTDRTLFTGYGAVVGTLEYMSPEQAGFNQLDVDTRSDIYSLGVLLYELLAGSTPLGSAWMKRATFPEILRRIGEEEPPRPSSRLSGSGEALAAIAAHRHTPPAELPKVVRGDLDGVVMKCLEKDRDRRYETATSLAADVQRYLNDEPTCARPITVRQRAWRWYRRNTAIVAGAFTAFTFLTPAVMYVALFCITQLIAPGPDGGELWSGLGFTTGIVLVYLACAESGVAACRGKRRGLWVSLAAFLCFSSMSLWTLHCAVVISREYSEVSVYSFGSFNVDTPDGRRGYIRNCVIGFALMGMTWSTLGLGLQIHALSSRSAERNRVPIPTPR
jgi:eukaryotic-like serine/threonine-protein kinase